MNELTSFERAAKRRIAEFNEPKNPKTTPEIGPSPKGLTVVLAVRTNGSLSDLHYIHQSDSVFRLQARLEAEKEAKLAGYPIIGHVVDYF